MVVYTFATPEGLLEPIQKFNTAVFATAQKLTARQTASLMTYTELALDQLKAASEVKDVEGLQTFLSKQTDVLKEVGERLWADTKAIAEMGIEFVSEAQKISTPEAPVASVKTEKTPVRKPQAPAAPAKAKATPASNPAS